MAKRLFSPLQTSALLKEWRTVFQNKNFIPLGFKLHLFKKFNPIKLSINWPGKETFSTTFMTNTTQQNNLTSLETVLKLKFCSKKNAWSQHVWITNCKIKKNKLLKDKQNHLRAFLSTKGTGLSQFLTIHNLRITDNFTAGKISKDKSRPHITSKNLSKTSKTFTSIAKPKTWSVPKRTVNKKLLHVSQSDHLQNTIKPSVLFSLKTQLKVGSLLDPTETYEWI